MKRYFIVAFSAAALCLAVVLSAGRAADEQTFPAGVSRAVKNLARSIPYQTISCQEAEKVEVEKFRAFHDFLAETYPMASAKLERTVVNDMSLIYTWKGIDPTLPALVYAAHIDVVPIAPGTESDWAHPPFSGAVADGHVWGRGTMDCKGILIGLMEAVESLLEEGYQPRRNIYLVFGHDEEVGGSRGAAEMALILKARGVKAYYVLDEGGFIVDGRPLGIEKPIALIGIAEKGYLSVELKVRTDGGHSSMPPDHSAIGILSEAITRLEAKPFPPKLKGAAMITFDSLAPELPLALRMAIKSQSLFKPIIVRELEKNSATNAMIRTTTAVTIIESGDKENVLPQEARAVVNFRLMPGDDIDYALERVRKVINDPRVEVTVIGDPREASQVSDTESPGYATLTGMIEKMFPKAVPVPYLVLGGTDARHYEIISDTVLRFTPHSLDESDQKRAHGTDERLSIDNLDGSVEFYRQLIKASN